MNDILRAEMIISETFDFFSLDKENRSLKREYVIARQVAMDLIKKNTKLSHSRIGEFFLNYKQRAKDHATVTHAIQTVNDLKKTDRHFKRDYEELEENCNFKIKDVVVCLENIKSLELEKCQDISEIMQKFSGVRRDEMAEIIVLLLKEIEFFKNKVEFEKNSI